MYLLTEQLPTVLALRDSLRLPPSNAEIVAAEDVMFLTSQRVVITLSGLHHQTRVSCKSMDVAYIRGSRSTIHSVAVEGVEVNLGLQSPVTVEVVKA